MGKALKPIAIGIAVVGLAVATGGISLAPTLGAGVTAAGTATAVGVTTFSTGLALSTTALGSIALNIGAASILSGVGAAFAKSPRTVLADLDRLTLSLVPSAQRSAVFGRTAFATDLRYAEPSGTDQAYVDYVIHLASHRSGSVEELHIEDQLAWTSAGGAQGIYAGYLTVETILEAGAAAYHTVNDGSKWGAAQRLTGCTTMKIRVKRTGNSKTAASPFAAGLPSRLTIVGNGMPVYDPRRDSTVAGGSGSHRATDCSTWEFTASGSAIGSNPALQALAWHLGWRVGGKVSVGLGLPASRLDLPAFAAAANICEESVTLAAGGTQRRFEGGGLIGDALDPRTVQQGFADATNGWFDDSSGKIAMYCAVNDLSGSLVHLTDDDIEAAPVAWDPFPAAVPNIVRGRNPSPAAPALYQPTDYPAVEIDSADGIDRALQLDLGLVQDKARAQRIAKQALQRQQYQGVFRARFGVRAWQLHQGEAIKLSFTGLGWSEKLFRVRDWTLNPDGSVDLELREEHASIYAWDADETAAVTPAAPVVYNPNNNPLILAAGELTDAANIFYSPDVSVASLEPAEAGADVTASHTSLDTANVGGRPTAAVVAQIDDQGKSARQLDISRGELARLAMRAVLDARRQRTVNRDVTILLDPATGKYRIDALDATNELVATASFRIDAMAGEIELRATTTQVASMIAVAGLTPAGEAAFDTLEVRIIDLEFSMSTATAQISLRATEVDLGTERARIDQAEIDIGALEDEIVLKVSTAAFGPVQDQLADVVLQLSTTPDGASLNQSLSSIKATADAGAKQSLWNILNAREARKYALRQVATISDDLNVRTSGLDAALAEAKRVLQVQVDTNAAAVSATQTALVEGLNAEASSRLLLSTTVGGHTAVLNEQAASIDGIKASYTLSFDVDGNISGFTLIGSAAGPAELGLFNTDLKMGTGRIIFDNGSHMRVEGLGFGTTNQFMEWYGPTLASPSLCSTANALSYKTVAGVEWTAATIAGSIAGVPAETVAGYTRNVDQGPWSASSFGYVQGDEVQHQSSTWGCRVNHTSSAGNGPPTLPTTENTNWRLRSKVGDTGAPGPSGPRGAGGNIIINSFGATAYIETGVGVGESVAARAALNTAPSSGGGNVTLTLEVSVNGGSASTLGTPDTGNTTVGEPVSLWTDGTYTNSTDTPVVLGVRANVTNTGSITTTFPGSYVQA